MIYCRRFDKTWL